MKVLLKRVGLDGHTIGFFYPQNHKLELYILSQILSLTDSKVLENSYEEQSNLALRTLS